MSRISVFIHSASILVSRVLPAALCSLIFWQFHRTVVLLGSGDPSVHPYLQLLATANRARSFAFFVGILGIFYGLQQRSLRQRAVGKMEKSIEEFRQP